MSSSDKGKAVANKGKETAEKQESIESTNDEKVLCNVAQRCQRGGLFSFEESKVIHVAIKEVDDEKKETTKESIIKLIKAANMCQRGGLLNFEESDLVFDSIKKLAKKHEININTTP